MTTTKRAYKLQEFVAHASSVNCLKIGRKSSRVLVTGGEDHKVNLWAIGKPNAILSLSGHTSGIDSVSFDSSEVLVAAGAASGTVKLWDLEEAKIVRTLTGHRSNCISLDFHPFGEFFASGSLDTNLKIWDIRRKGCIHTYKGHTRGVNAIRFTPDGRWVVSGGEDNSVKARLWDLTAGKLLHDFKCHEGQIQCIDFHPHEFLLATGSADRTVKFWDLETFELIGSTGPETTGVRCITFNPDGKTLLCGLHESLKVVSWEPIRCHDAVDVGWSRLSDLNIYEGKLLGCSYNQSCVGVWVVDISRIEPYTVGNRTLLNSNPELKLNSSGILPKLAENSSKISLGRLSISQDSDPISKDTKSLGRLSASQNSDPVMKESKSFPFTGSAPGTPQRVNSNSGPKTTPISSVSVSGATALKRNMAKLHSTANASFFNASDAITVVVPRSNGRLEQAAELRKEAGVGKMMPLPLQTKTSEIRKFSNLRDDLERPIPPVHPEADGFKVTELSGVASRNVFPAEESSAAGNPEADMNRKDGKCIVSGRLGTNLKMEPLGGYQHDGYETRVHKGNRDVSSTEGQKGGWTRSLVASWEKSERYQYYEAPASSNSSGKVPVVSMLQRNVIVHRYWERHDVRGAIGAMEKMADHAVLADVISFLTEKPDIITLDTCTCLLPLLTGLLESSMDSVYYRANMIRCRRLGVGNVDLFDDIFSNTRLRRFACKERHWRTWWRWFPSMDVVEVGSNVRFSLLGVCMRHQDLSLDILLKLVRVFGSVIYSSLSVSSSVGVDIEAEQRLERCNLCFIELEKVKHCLPVLTRRGGSIAKCAQELNLALQEVSRA
ncbi:hypothetical protein RHGRI_034063 [Rhododendron griersonianum]|uniref:Katanin p80 WD40 repeat-containing subunit B1 homolog n=1 Tax=Rhododendron griersonianum TaxID=479676 RepID=A0AAV6HZ26_9ERIC|nr:hypothetical protein RHGRI_034063 [Rhododendron griersonianum]